MNETIRIHPFHEKIKEARQWTVYLFSRKKGCYMARFGHPRAQQKISVATARLLAIKELRRLNGRRLVGLYKVQWIAPLIE